MSLSFDRSARDVDVVSRISWGAVAAGAVTAVVAQLVLNVLGLGLGLSAVNATSGAGATSLSVGAGLWILLTALVTYAVGGFIAGRLSNARRADLGGYHGIVTWAATTLILLVIVTSAVGGALTGAFSIVSGTVGGAGQALSGVVAHSAGPLAQIGEQVGDPTSKILQDLKAKANDPDSVAARDQAIDALRTAFSADPAQRQVAEDKAVQALSKVTGQSPDQARAQIADYRQRYQDLLDKSKQAVAKASEKTASVVSIGALVLALALILGAGGAFAAGRSGARVFDAL